MGTAAGLHNGPDAGAEVPGQRASGGPDGDRESGSCRRARAIPHRRRDRPRNGLRSAGLDSSTGHLDLTRSARRRCSRSHPATPDVRRSRVRPVGPGHKAKSCSGGPQFLQGRGTGRC